MSLSELFTTFVDAAASRDKAVLSNLLALTVTYNDLPPFRPHDDMDAFVASTVSPEIKGTLIDALIVDDETNKVAARLIHSAGQQLDGTPAEWSKHVLVWFQDSKVVRVHSLEDGDRFTQIKQGIPLTPVPRSDTPFPASSADLSYADMQSNYKDYVAAVNSHTLPDIIPRFLSEKTTNNTVTTDVDEFIAIVEGFFGAVQGLYFELKELICSSSTRQIGAVIEFTGTPVSEFRGIQPTGRDVRFTEFVLYRLNNGKIRTVWQIMDFPTYRKCLSGEIDAGL